MTLQNESFYVTVEACMDVDDLGSKIEDDPIIYPKSVSQQRVHKGLFITAISKEHTLKIALIGDGYTDLKHCAVLKENVLTILQNDLMVQLDVANGSLIRDRDFEWCGCNLELYQLENDYLIYGEEYIVRLDDALKEKWRFSGKDIFVSISGKQPFELGPDSIRLYDFQDNFYEIDFSGQLIAKSDT